MTLTRAQLSTLAGFTPSGGTFGTYFGTLKRHGLLPEAANGDVAITAQGLRYLGSDAPSTWQTTAEQIKRGRFSSASEAIRAGLRLLEEHELKLAALRQALKGGEDSGMAAHSLTGLLEDLDWEHSQ